MSVTRARPGFGMTLRGLLHMRLRALGAGKSLLRFAVAFVVVFGLGLLSREGGEADQYWLTALTLFVNGFLPLYCLTKGGEALRIALKDGTMEYLWSRPVRRGQLFLGFYSGALLSNLALIGCCLLALTLAGWVAGAEAGISGLALLWLQSILAVAAFTAISMLLAAWSSKFVALGIVYFVLIEVGLGSMPTRVSALSVGEHVRSSLAPLADAGARWAEAPLLGPVVGVVAIGGVALLAGMAVFLSAGYVVGGDKD